MDALKAYLPSHDGLLPQWLLFVSAISVGNSVQCYFSPSSPARVYNGPAPTSPSKPSNSKSKSKAIPAASSSPVTPLSSRTFGTWTFLSCVIRLYGAYYTSDPRVYELTFVTYAVAWVHFMLEWLVFRSARMGPGLASPALVSSTSMVWMWLQWGYYVKA